jgi:putative transposase
MDYFLIAEQKKTEMISILGEFIRSNPDARELKRALAVKMALEGKPYTDITRLLEINKSFISYWKKRFYEQGIVGIKLGYRGAKSLLADEERLEVINWLQTKNYWNLDELVSYLDLNYDVVYQSKQSYYDLFSEAGISWKRTQKMNPQSNPELVKKNEQRSKSSFESISLRLNLDN